VAPAYGRDVLDGDAGSTGGGDAVHGAVCAVYVGADAVGIDTAGDEGQAEVGASRDHAQVPAEPGDAALVRPVGWVLLCSAFVALTLSLRGPRGWVCTSRGVPVDQDNGPAGETLHGLV
jgi:hypothetical protein